MRKVHSLGLLLLSVGLCLSAPSYAHHRARMGGASLSSPNFDLRFADAMTIGTQTEVDLGKIALQNGVDADVRDFAQRMIDDNTLAGNELKILSQRQNQSLPTELDGFSRREEARLSNLSGSDFDRAYMADMVRDQRFTLAAFQRELALGGDTDLESWSQSKLPMIQDHLRMARQIDAKIRKND